MKKNSADNHLGKIAGINTLSLVDYHYQPPCDDLAPKKSFRENSVISAAEFRQAQEIFLAL